MLLFYRVAHDQDLLPFFLHNEIHEWCGFGMDPMDVLLHGGRFGTVRWMSGVATSWCKILPMMLEGGGLLGSHNCLDEMYTDMTDGSSPSAL